jgi:hypothetical protein
MKMTILVLIITAAVLTALIGEFSGRCGRVLKTDGIF